MTTFGSERIGDEVILAARILLVVLFLIFGWSKLADFSGTVAYMAQTGVPAPAISALVAIAMEAFVPIAVVLGIWTRPVAIVLALYALATGFLGHHYWTMTGAARFESETNFYKNLSIMGGFLLLYVTGAGKYSLDARRGASIPGAKLRSV
jgi:putative oxidoreductase